MQRRALIMCEWEHGSSVNHTMEKSEVNNLTQIMHKLMMMRREPKKKKNMCNDNEIA